MIIDGFGIYPPGFNTIQGLWKPVSSTNTIGKAGLLGKVVTNAAAVAATGTLTIVTTPTDGDTVTIGGQVYRWKTTIAAINDVLIGGSATNALANLKLAINAGAGAGTNYYTGTLINQYVAGTTATATTLLVTALELGTTGNAVATTASDSANATWASATLTGGVNGTLYAPGGQAAFSIVTAASDYPTDILVDDGSQTGDTTNLGGFVSCAPIDALVQFRVPVVLGSGNPGDLMILAPSPNLGSVQPLTGSIAGTYTRTFQALEAYQPGQSVLLRKYYGTQT
jgi:hypothetical protein